MKDSNKEKLERVDRAIDEVLLLAEEEYIELSTYEEVKRGFDSKILALEEAEKLALAERLAQEQVPEEAELPKQQQPIPKQAQTSTPRPTVVKKQRSPEENRRRRLTYILTSGVALLLLGGVLLALTNWLTLAPVTKVFLISGIAVVFAGMSYLAHKLKINQTMLAFLMLFAFFVPIVFFSISYYGVFGSYLSVGGEGSMLFAAVSSLICAALYAFLYSLEANKTFQIVALIATAASSMYAAGFISSTVEMYVLTIAVLILIQLLIWNKALSSKYLQTYRLFLPWFVLAQLVLITFVQFVLFDWTQAGFLNYAVLGVLYYFLALRHAAYRVVSIPAVLGFSIGVTGLLFINQIMNESLYALMALILPVILLTAYLVEKKNGRDALMYVPIKIVFFITVFFTHIVAQLMLLIDEVSPNLYSIPLLGLAVLLITCGWLVKQRLTLFFGYLLSAYTIWLLFTFYVESMGTRSILVATFFLAVYAATIFVPKISSKFIRHPLKLISAVALVMIALQLASSVEWSILTGLLFTLSLVASLFSRFEQIPFKRIASMSGVVFIFFAVVAAYFARAGDLVYLLPLETTNHFLIGATLLSCLYFLYKRIHEQSTAALSFAGGGMLYITLLMAVLYQYSTLASVYPLMLTGYALAGVVYFLMASIIVFKQPGYYVGVLVFGLLAYMSVLNTTIAETTLGFWSILLLAGTVFTWVGKALKAKTAYGGMLFYASGQILLVLIGLMYAPLIELNNLSVHGLLVPFVFLTLEVILSKQKLWRLGQSLAAGLFLLLHNFIWFSEMSFVTESDSLLLTGGIVLLCMLWKPLSYNKKGIIAGLSILNVYPLAILLTEANQFGIVKIAIVLLISAATVYYLEEKWKKADFTAIPYAFAAFAVLLGNVETIVTVLLLVGLAFAGKAAGVHYIGWSFIQHKRVNTYQIISTILVAAASLQLRSDTSIGTELELILATVLFAYLVLLFIKEPSKHVRYIKGLTLLGGFYYPYSLLLSLLPVADEYIVFLYTVPFMVLVSLLLRVVAKEDSWRPPVEMVAVVLGFIVMSLSTLANQTLYGSLTLSILAVLAILVGFYLKYAAYFVTGVVALLVNTLYATRTFWSSIPWWVYLMAGGAILIGFATYQELKKREDETTVKEQWSQLIKRIKGFFTHWT